MSDSLLYLTNECKYKLSDFGPYECYYSYNSGKYIRSADRVANLYNDEIGNLIFYDRITKEAKFIQIYNHWHDEETYSSYRYFFIDPDKTIQLFEIIYGETETEVYKSYRIKVKDNGEIIIKKTADE